MFAGMMAAAISPPASASPTVDVVVDATAAGADFEHKWKRSFGSGHSSLTLRKDWRSHYAKARVDLGISGVRYHGLFDDDMAVVPAPGVYDFALVDSTWDFLLAQGTHPIVELSFMPAFVANCTWHGHCKQDKIDCQGYWCTQCNGHGVGPIVNPTAPANCSRLEFWYQGIKQVPYQRDFGRWYDLIRRTAQHAIARYGLAEVQKWSFEVWNELWGMPFPDDYMALYNASARALKAVHPTLRVGGPATAVLQHVADFVSECEKGQIPYDFVSTHHYPTDNCPKGADWDPDCFNHDVLRSRQTVPSELPYYLTEYNVGCCLGYTGHDVSTAAAFVFRTVGTLNEALDLYSYWTFTDVFEEGGLPRVEYKNIYGAMSVSGVPKPVWRAFELLHAHAGRMRLPTTLSNQTGPTQPPLSAAKPLWAVAVPCNASDTTQLGWSFTGGALQWTPTTMGAGAAPMCLDSLGGTAALQLTLCSYLQPSQAFARDGAAFKQNGHCVDVYEPDTPKYRRVDLYVCNGGANQQFDVTSEATLSAHSNVCVAARDTPAGPPPPPRPPPVTPKAYVSAFATRNAKRPGAVSGVAAFLSFWADPEASSEALPADRTVRLLVRHKEATATPTTAAVYAIDDVRVNPTAVWARQGSPNAPNATQLAELMEASAVDVQQGVHVIALNSSCSMVEVSMRANSVAVVAF